MTMLNVHATESNLQMNERITWR